MDMNIPNEIQDLCQAFLRGLDAVLDAKLYAVYLYGALAFPEGGATGDVDFHVILTQPPNDQEKADLNALHATLARDYPPLGGEMDGYYILLEDARQTSPPRHQLLPNVVDNSWALHRAHILAGRCIALYGPDPEQVYPPASWPELESALQGELDYVEQHLDDYPAYCVLNLCRLMYSFRTGDVVVSKRTSAVGAATAFPKWRSLIQAARTTYDQQATLQEKELLKSEVRSFFKFACERVRESRDRVDNG
jgi:hypothetical protein